MFQILTDTSLENQKGYSGLSCGKKSNKSGALAFSRSVGAAVGDTEFSTKPFPLASATSHCSGQKDSQFLELVPSRSSLFPKNQASVSMLPGLEEFSDTRSLVASSPL